jgi:hypothetical protein
MGLSALSHDILSRLHFAGGEQPELAFDSLNVFEHHYGVGAGGDWSAGHDLPGSARRQWPRRSLPGMSRPNKIKLLMRRSLGGAACIAIAGRASEGRLIAVC